MKIKELDFENLIVLRDLAEKTLSLKFFNGNAKFLKLQTECDEQLTQIGIEIVSL